MKVVKKTGLVPVHTKHDATVFGVPPAAAIKGVIEGKLFLFPIPDDVETIEFDDPKVPELQAEPEVADPLGIPDDWESLHYAKIIVIAKNIVGGDLPEVEDKKPAEVARDIIREELSRRAAGISETPAE